MNDDDSRKVTILLQAFEHTQSNYRYLGSRAQSLFSWIGSVLLAVIGVITALGPSRIALFGLYLQIGLTLSVGSLFAFAWISEIMIFKARVVEAKSAVKIGRMLHFFEAGYFDETTVIFDEDDWSFWKGDRLKGWGLTQHTSVLFVLTAIAMTVIWIL